MKHTLQTLTSRFLGVLWFVASVCMVVSCSDDTDKAGGNLKLYYPDMTDIGPSMTGVKIPAPSFQGATPSEFAIAAVTLNDEAIETDCFVIDETTGEITINSTTETAVGEYKLTVSCSAAGRYFTFKDIIKVTFLPRAPEGTVADPNKILVMYSVVSDPNDITKLPTAQVKTEGEHVSITQYSIGTVTVNGEVVEKPEEMFEVSASGEISITKNNRFQRGAIYLVSLKLETAATGNTPCIAPDILTVEVASEPFSLTYPEYDTEEGWKMPNASNDEGGSSFTSEVPVFIGSTDGIKYWIEIDNEKGKDKILIDETTGIISVPQGHGFDVGDKFNINVFVANTYLTEGKKLATLKLEVTKFYKPLTDDLVFYTTTTTEQTDAITINTENWANWGYEDLKFYLLEGWNNRLTIDPISGKISAEEGNSIAVGEYNIPFRVTNGDGTTKEYSFKLTVNENTKKLVWIKCGNNLGANGTALEGEQYENQFRFDQSDDILSFTTEIKANIDNVTFTLEAKNSLFGYSTNGLTCDIENNKTFKVTALRGNVAPKGGVYVSVIKGTTIDGKVLKVPLFICYNNQTEAYDATANPSLGKYVVEYTPFVYRINPKIGGTMSVIPKMYKVDNDTKTEINNFYLDYRKDFEYQNLNSSLTAGKSSKAGTFMNSLWVACGLSDGNKKSPLSQYNNDTNIKLGQVNKDNTVTINEGKWVLGTTYASGFMKAEMYFDLNTYGMNDKPLFEVDADNKNRVSPLIIWLDPDYYPVAE